MTPPTDLDPKEYVATRVEGQRKWYENRARRAERRWILIGTLVALVTGLSTVLNWFDVATTGPFVDGVAATSKFHGTVVAIVGVLMALSSALTGLATLTSAEYQVSNYRATARQLRRLLREWYLGVKFAGPGGFARFVEQVETTLSAEQAAWRRQAIRAADTVPSVVPPTVPVAPPVTAEPPATPGAPPAPAEAKVYPVAGAPVLVGLVQAPSDLLSPHFTLAELTVSRVAKEQGIDNTPRGEHLENLRATALGLERVRDLLGGLPIHVTSGYRAEALNQRLPHAAKGSDHQLGWCVDFVCVRFGTPLEVARAIADSPIMADVDQLIYERNLRGNEWVHISFSPRRRGQKLTGCFRMEGGQKVRHYERDLHALDAEGFVVRAPAVG